MSRRRQFDDWQPTIVRYIGTGLMTALITAQVLGYSGFEAAYVPATGMILYKTVKGAAENGDIK